MLKAYKYRIYPTEEQKLKINQTIGVCRLVYNLALEVKITAYKNAGINLSAFNLINQLPELKKAYPWIGEVDSQCVQAAVKNIEVAFNMFYKGMGFPKFKKRRNGGSFKCPNNARRIDFEKGTITIPKIPNIPASIPRTFNGTIKNITVSKTASNKYFASLLVDNFIDLPLKAPVVLCDECCNGDRCDDPTHRRRESCHACLGTGINATAEKLNEERILPLNN